MQFVLLLGEDYFCLKGEDDLLDEVLFTSNFLPQKQQLLITFS